MRRAGAAKSVLHPQFVLEKLPRAGEIVIGFLYIG